MHAVPLALTHVLAALLAQEHRAVLGGPEVQKARIPLFALSNEEMGRGLFSLPR